MIHSLSEFAEFDIKGDRVGKRRKRKRNWLSHEEEEEEEDVVQSLLIRIPDEREDFHQERAARQKESR